MRITSRETTLAVATLVVALFGGTAILGKPKVEEWKEIRKKEKQVREDIALDRRLIDQRADWTKRFEDISAELPSFARKEKIDVHWMSVMNRLASATSLRILRQEPGDEQDLGDVFEFSIDCKDWEGLLEAIVRFLHALHAEGAMFDVRYLWIKPKAKDLLRGHFTLYCAYTRESAEDPK